MTTARLIPSLLLLPALSGCVADTPRNVNIPQPEHSRPAKLVLSSTYPRDTNSNGYPDSLAARIHLFEDEGGFPLSLAADGTFHFELASPKGKTFASWSIGGDDAKRAMIRDSVGPCYVFELSLLADGKSDKIDAEKVDLHATFTPATPDSAPPIRGSGIVSLHFGRAY
jgi:hypothetical protein